MKRLYYAVSAFLLAMFGLASAIAADDYKGADAVLNQQPAPQASPSPSAHGSWLNTFHSTVESPIPATSQKWLDDVKEYGDRSPTLSPGEAARQWADLASRYVAFSGAEFNPIVFARPNDPHRFMLNSTLKNPLIRTLPGPAAWPALAKEIDSRAAQAGPQSATREAALQLLANTLIANMDGQRKALAALVGEPSKPNANMQTPTLEALENAVAEQSDDPGVVTGALQAEITLEKKNNEHSFEGSRRPFFIPDLVTILGGEKKAEPLLTEAILLPHVQLEVNGAATKALATKLALGLVEKMPDARWDLAAYPPDGAALYEALTKRFQPKDSESYEMDQAKAYYLLHLILQGQTNQAIALVESSPADDEFMPFGRYKLPFEQMELHGYTQQVHDFLHDLLTKHPEVPLWSDYIRASAKTGQTAAMLDLIRATAKRTDLSDTQHQSARSAFYLAFLAADQIDEGIAELRKIIAGQDQADGNAIEKNVALARIGELLERKDLMEEGVAEASKIINTGSDDILEKADAVTSLAELLTESGRGPEAEELLAKALSRTVSPHTRRPLAAALARVYYRAGRPGDVIELLQKFPDWGAADLKDMLGRETNGFEIAEFSSHAAPDDLPLGYLGAWALAQQGQKDQAVKVVNALLDRMENFDPGYELLLKLSGQDAIPHLDALARRDRFETRPLIWKAQLQLDAGKLDDAEKTARAAIAIDPSDGQQGPGRRMRAYAVLADILDRKGDKEHAQFYRGVVSAIRISEHADRFYEAGLLTRAVKMYQEALTHFSDAYCIQSRLALRLSELGDNAGAEEHYRRAYELMPESFGRVESHCFGCERAFAGARAQSIAKKVFTGLAKTMPDKPQVHYLLGYLRYEQGRYPEALPEFEQAVKLDPDYLNAWVKIQDTGKEMHLPMAVLNEVALNVARLDPLHRHNFWYTSNATNLADLWNAVAAAQSLVPRQPGPLLPLTASAAQMKNASSTEQFQDMDIMEMQAVSSLYEAMPLIVIRKNPFISNAAEILEMPILDLPRPHPGFNLIWN